MSALESKNYCQFQIDWTLVIQACALHQYLSGKPFTPELIESIKNDVPLNRRNNELRDPDQLKVVKKVGRGRKSKTEIAQQRDRERDCIIMAYYYVFGYRLKDSSVSDIWNAVIRQLNNLPENERIILPSIPRIQNRLVQLRKYTIFPIFEEHVRKLAASPDEANEILKESCSDARESLWASIRHNDALIGYIQSAEVDSDRNMKPMTVSELKFMLSMGKSDQRRIVGTRLRSKVERAKSLVPKGRQMFPAL